ncbi:hypothetical protein BSKO_00886 [Bryopsis sp. KO-2023]|nr:hypothetical protein BSKO_00886 [Bryopsis sp. KO-2023]
MAFVWSQCYRLGVIAAKPTKGLCSRSFLRSRLPSVNRKQGCLRPIASTSRSTQRRAVIERQPEMTAKEIGASYFAGAMPKEETGALKFMKEHPEFDGRGTVVAIFDTGVDPGASGLQVTSDGKPKIIDVLDGTGSGDVDTSKVVELDEDGCLTGLTGRKLKVNSEWKNPSGKWHIGSKHVFELVCSGLVPRLKSHRLKSFQEKQRAAVAEASAALAKFDTANPDVSGDDDKKKERGELESRVKLLLSMMEKLNDVGPIIDCVVWHDGDKWRAALDTSDMYEPDSAEGLLADFVPLTNFRDERKYGTFSAIDACNFACNIYEEGNVLCIVVDIIMHGTHVAGIVGANHPDNPELNGIAPGCQIISCKIGDTRLGSIETGPGMTRAIVAALEHKVDLCNMSYGECIAIPNGGRFIELLKDLTNKHNIVFVASAGNSGPGMTTLGGPGVAEHPITVGAYVSPGFAAAGHSMREELDEGQQYTFTSRGPSIDGATGVDISAPGGAISVVPQWTQQCRQLANGTSMASPNACGGIALLLSGLKATGGAITSNRIRRAVENTAQVVDTGDLPVELTHGRGLLQVDKAWQYLEKSGEVDFPDVRYEVRVQRSDGGVSMRGIYMREPADVLRPLTWMATVKPRLHEDADVRDEKLAIEDRLSLKSTQPWLSCPEALLLPHNGRAFEVKVDPTGLKEGVHYAEVQGSDVAAPWRGPLFRVPVTVVVPGEAPPSTNGTGPTDTCFFSLGKTSFSPGKELRRFISVPTGATWAEVTMRAGQHTGTKVFSSEIKQLVMGQRYDTHTWNGYVQMPSNGMKNIAFKVLGGKMMEVAVSQYWSNLGDSELEIDVTFHGLEVAPGTNLHLDGSAGMVEFQVTAPICREFVKPDAKLTSVCIPLRPTDSLVEPFSAERDSLPESRILSKLNLSYKLTVTEAGKFTANFPMLNNQVYDAEVEGQLVMFYDENKKYIASSDIYPETVDLKKGDYTIKAMIRHEKPEFLEKLKAMPLILIRKLEKSVALPVYSTKGACVAAGPQFKGRELYVGETVNMVLGNTSEDLAKDCTPGSVLTGTMNLGMLTNGKGPAPSSVALTYTTPPAKPSSNNDNSDKAEEKDAKEKIVEAVRDAKIKVLEGLKVIEDEEAYSALLAELKKDFPNHIPLLSAALKKLDTLKEEDRKGRLSDIVKAADEVVSAIDQTELAVFLARKTPEEGKEASQRSKEMSKKETAIIDALKAKATALLDMEAENQADVEKVIVELGKWVNISDAPHAILHAKREAQAGRLAEAIKSLDSALASDDRTKSLDKKLWKLRSEYLGKLGWHHWERQASSILYTNFPPDFQLF